MKGEEILEETRFDKTKGHRALQGLKKDQALQNCYKNFGPGEASHLVRICVFDGEFSLRG